MNGKPRSPGPKKKSRVRWLKHVPVVAEEWCSRSPSQAIRKPSSLCLVLVPGSSGPETRSFVAVRGLDSNPRAGKVPVLILQPASRLLEALAEVLTVHNISVCCDKGTPARCASTVPQLLTCRVWRNRLAPDNGKRRA